MKTADSKINMLAVVALLIFAQAVAATGFLSLDADLRYRNTDFSENEFVFEAMGMSVRKVVSDATADRWVLFAQVEAMDDFTHIDLHQMYAMLKGPLGKWNVTAGRFRLPYGLLVGYSADRMLFTTNESYTIGNENDDGIMVSGTIRSFEYALSVTRGVGIFDGFPEDGLLTGRAGLALGESGDWVAGISAAAGTTLFEHGSHNSRMRRKAGALDITGYVGRAALRAEGSLGKQGERFQAAAFGGVDYAISAPAELNTAISVVWESGKFHHAWGFVGSTFNTKWVTLRGGYRYVHSGSIDHQISLQMYKLFSFPF